MAKPDVSAYESFDQITSRLDEIVSQVKKKDTSIEHSLELFDEAIALGSKAVDLVDVSPVSEAEKAQAAQAAPVEQANDAGAQAASGQESA